MTVATDDLTARVGSAPACRAFDGTPASWHPGRKRPASLVRTTALFVAGAAIVSGILAFRLQVWWPGIH